MTCCLDFFCSCIATSLTGECLNSCLCTGWGGCYLSIIPCMTERWYFFLSFKYLIAYTTMTACCKSCLRTGWCYCFFIDCCMACCLDLFCSCLSTSLTGKCLNSCLCTGWGGCYLSIIPCMPNSWYFFLCLKHFITYTTMTACCKSCLCTSRCYCLVIDCCMTYCLDFFCSCLSASLAGKCLDS